MSEQESLASLKILAALAKADGVVAESEKTAIEGILGGQALPAGTTVDSLLAESIDLKAEISRVTSKETRESTYSAAVAMAKADGAASPEEEKILAELRSSFGISEEHAKLMDRLFQEAKDTISIKGIAPISDPEKRAAAIKEDTIKYSVLSAVLGAFPIPGIAIATDLAVVGIQAKLVRDVGQYYGQPLADGAAKTLLGSIVGGAGARIALNNLAKLVPGFGSVFGATSSFATTWAISRVAVQYFEHGGKLDVSALKDAFKLAKKDGEKAYKENAGAVDAKRAASEARIKELSEDLKAGKISKEDYEHQVASL